MGLVDLAEVQDLLWCPICHGELTLGGAQVLCTNPTCPRHAPSHGYPIIANRWPVLIDFDRSIVDERTFAQSSGAHVNAAHETTTAPVSSIRRLYSRIVRPENKVATAHVEKLDGMLPSERPLVLVVGGGTVGNGLASLYNNPRFRVLAFDIFASPEVQFLADAHQVPLADGSVDAVIVQAVLEHVLDPPMVVREVHRVLRTDGIVYAETPFMQQVHAGPYDFTRFSESGHRWLFRQFEEIDSGVVAGAGTALLWSIDHLTRSIFRSAMAGRLARLIFFWVRFADRIASSSFDSDAASALFFLGRRSDHSLRPIDIIDRYRGAQSVPAAVADGTGGNPKDE